MVSPSVNTNNNATGSSQNPEQTTTKVGPLNQTLLDLIHSNSDITDVQLEYNPNFTKLPAVEKLQITLPHMRPISPSKITTELSNRTTNLTLVMGRHRSDEIPQFIQYFALNLQSLKLNISFTINFGIMDSGDLGHVLHSDGAACLKFFLHEVQQAMPTAQAASIEINLAFKLIGNKRLSPAERSGILLNPELAGFVFDTTDQAVYRVLLGIPTLQCNVIF